MWIACVINEGWILYTPSVQRFLTEDKVLVEKIWIILNCTEVGLKVCIWIIPIKFFFTYKYREKSGIC